MTYFNDKTTGDPKWIAGDEEHETALAQCGISVEAAARIAAHPPRWLVENVIPADGVTVIAGEPGAGKTFFACQLAADAARVSQCRVVLATSGYEAQDLLRWRLDQADADTRRIVLATLTPNGFNDRCGGPGAKTIDERMAVLYHTLQGAGDPTSGILPKESSNARRAFEARSAAELLVIDDVDGWFGKPGQCVSAAILARVVARLNELARSLKVAVVPLVRTQVGVEGRVTSRQLSRLSQSAGVVWMVVKDQEQPLAYAQSQRRWLLPVKNNLAPDVATFGRAFELFDGQIRWHGDERAPSLAGVQNNDRRQLRQAATEWLREALAAGPLLSKELYRQGVENGFSKGTLKRAAAELGIQSHKTGLEGGWEMRWTPPVEIRGGDATARRAGTGFRIFGGDEKHAEPLPANCASSEKHSESSPASCASSEKHGESSPASCASSSEGRPVSDEECDAENQKSRAAG